MAAEMQITNVLWEDCTIGFLCPVCSCELQVDSQNEPTTCDCGSKYYLSARIKKIMMGKDGTPERIIVY